MTSVKLQGIKPAVPSIVSRPTTKEKEKKSFSSAYTGDDDINDVAAMGGVNLAEETQKILGSTEFVGTQIRSCKEEIMCSMGPLQQKIRQIVMKHGLEEPSADVAACISHAAQERLKNLIEKLAIITEHRLEIVKTDQRYEITNDVKGISRNIVSKIMLSGLSDWQSWLSLQIKRTTSQNVMLKI
jgi:transcription initiation factor TFIID subunit 4